VQEPINGNRRPREGRHRIEAGIVFRRLGRTHAAQNDLDRNPASKTQTTLLSKYKYRVVDPMKVARRVGEMGEGVEGAVYADAVRGRVS